MNLDPLYINTDKEVGIEVVVSLLYEPSGYSDIHDYIRNYAICFQQFQLPLQRAVEMGNYQCAQVIIDSIGLVSVCSHFLLFVC